MLSRLIYIKDILKMALPIMLGNIGFIMIGVGDVLVAGRHSTDTLAAISLATAITNCLMMFGIGILASISSILSNYRGERKDINKYFYSSIKFAMILACITACMILACVPFIDKIGFESKLVNIIKDYFVITAFASFGGYLHCMTKEFLQAHEVVIFPNILTILCVFLNVGLNILFVFGFKIIPEMGAVGLALASLITRYFMGIVLFIYCIKKFNVGYIKDFNYFKDLLKVGIPATFAIMIEFIAFNAVSVIMGRISGIYAAAHNILTTITTVTFMIPFAFSIATSVKVGFSNGKKDYYTLQKYAWTGISMCVSFMFISSIFILALQKPIINLFTNDSDLANVCMPIMVLIACLQVFDGLQVALSGIFRGLKKTCIVMTTNFISYWLIFFPIGYYLGIYKGMNLIGFWYSIVFAAAILCLIMLTALIKRLNLMNKKYI